MRPTSIFGTPARATDMVGAAPSVSADDAASCMVMDESIFVCEEVSGVGDSPPPRRNSLLMPSSAPCGHRPRFCPEIGILLAIELAKLR